MDCPHGPAVKWLNISRRKKPNGRFADQPRIVSGDNRGVDNDRGGAAAAGRDTDYRGRGAGRSRAARPVAGAGLLHLRGDGWRLRDVLDRTALRARSAGKPALVRQVRHPRARGAGRAVVPPPRAEGILHRKVPGAASLAAAAGGRNNAIAVCKVLLYRPDFGHRGSGKLLRFGILLRARGLRLDSHQRVGLDFCGTDNGGRRCTGMVAATATACAASTRRRCAQGRKSGGELPGELAQRPNIARPSGAGHFGRSWLRCGTGR